MLNHIPMLSVLIWLPVVGALAILFAGEQRKTLVKSLAVSVMILSMLICIPLYMQFDSNSYQMQFVENVLWIPNFGIHYALGVDGISLIMVILSTFTSLIVVIAACEAIQEKIAQYMATFLILQGMMVGVFAATDAILFYVFWEAMLIPMYICIGVWGGHRRNYAAIKFFMYTFLGSVLMLVALLFLGWQAHSFVISDLYDLKLAFSTQIFLFIAFFLAFAVKVPMWPFHTWLPDAHTEAPAGGSVVLAALMLKMGVYGFLRFSLPIAPLANQSLYWLMIVLSLIMIIYIGFVAIAQTDFKRLIAYSSIAHMGVAVLGCFMVYPIVLNSSHAEAYLSLEGATVQMVSHAFSSGAMFLGFGFLYQRFATRKIADFGGVASTMPVFAAFFMLFAMSNVGLPGTAGFVGEFMVILSAFKVSFWLALLTVTTIVIAPVYTLWIYGRVFFGKVTNDNVRQLHDIRGTEWITFCLLAAGVFLVGLYPQCILTPLHVTVGHLLTDSLQFNPRS